MVGEGRVPAGVGDAGTGSVRQPDSNEVKRISRQMPAGIRARLRCNVVGVLYVMIRGSSMLVWRWRVNAPALWLTPATDWEQARA
jgi:hypothetical protein